MNYYNKVCLLRKQAAGKGGYFMPAAAAALTTGAIAGGAKLLSTARSVVKDDVAPVASKLSDYAFIGLPVLALLGAYGLSKVTSPTTITENADDLLYLNSLKTETAAARRQLKALEDEQQMDKNSSKKVFDKFLS